MNVSLIFYEAIEQPYTSYIIISEWLTQVKFTQRCYIYIILLLQNSFIYASLYTIVLNKLSTPVVRSANYITLAGYLRSKKCLVFPLWGYNMTVYFDNIFTRGDTTLSELMRVKPWGVHDMYFYLMCYKNFIIVTSV